MDAQEKNNFSPSIKYVKMFAMYVQVDLVL